MKRKLKTQNYAQSPRVTSDHPQNSISEEVSEPVFRTAKSKKRTSKKNVLSSQHFSPGDPENGGGGLPVDVIKEGGSNEFDLRLGSMLDHQEEQRILSGGSPIREMPQAEDSCRSSQTGLTREKQTPRSAFTLK